MRGWLGWGITAALVVVMSGCSSSGGASHSSDESTSGGTPKAGGTVTVAVEAETPGWYPPNGLIAASGRVVNRLVYGSLTVGQPDGTFVPYLAKSVTPDKTLTSWTIGLRPGMKFQDGSPFDADAVNFSINTMIDPKSATSAIYPFVKSSEVVDDVTVKVTLKKSLSTFPLYLSGGLGDIFSKQALKKEGADKFNSAPVGAGPYKMTSWVHDSAVTLERFDGFFDPKAAYPDKIVIKPIPDDAARAAALTAGDVDAIVTQSAADIVKFDKDKSVKVEKTNYGVNGFFVNFEHPPLDDIRIRQAMDHALDKKALIDLVWKGLGDTADNWFAKGGKWTVDVAAREHDVSKAKALVKEYTDEKGAPPTIEIIAPPTATYAALNQAVKQQLAEVGIKLKIGTVTDAATQITRMFAGDFGLSAYVMPSFLDPDYEMGRWFQSTSFLNVNHFKSPQVDADIAKAQGSDDATVRHQAYGDLQKQVSDNVAGIYLRQNVYALVLGPNVGYESGKTFGEYYTPVLADLLWHK
jgi:ABC-type transport system substrate-binding protein